MDTMGHYDQARISTTPVLAPVRLVANLASALSSLARLHMKTTLFFCGLTVDDFKLPARNLGRPLLVDLTIRVAIYIVRLLKIVFYPEIMFRSVAVAILFQSLYQGGGYFYKKFRAKVLTLTKYGRDLAHFRKKMSEAQSYCEYRAAEKEFLIILGSAHEPLDDTQKKIVAQLTGKVERYRTFIRRNDVRRLQFELRSDLLRKHFGHDQFHPLVRQAMQRYVSIVCCAFGLIATGQIPDALEDLVLDDDSNERPHVDDDGAADPVETPEIEMDDNGEELSSHIRAQSPFSEQPMSIEEKLARARNRLDFFVETRHSFGRSALLLSGGARMGLYHVGVVKTLLEHRLLPRVISGSSAGSIIAAVLACKNDDEIRAQLFDPEQMNLRFFGRSDSIDVGLQAMLKGEEPPDYIKNSLLAAFTNEENGGNGLLGTLLMLLPPPFPSYIMILRKLLPRWIDSKTLLDIDVLKTAIRNIVGDMTFQEAFDRTGRIVNITVTPHGGDREVPNLLNYLTAPYVTLWSASCASCCIPGVFAPVTLMVKTLEGTLEPYNPAGLRWIDGSLESDLPMERLSELFNMNHSICSQVNPHGAILAPHDHNDLEELSSLDRRFLASMGRLTQFARDQSRSYLKHAASLGLKSTIFKPLRGLIPVLTQKYSGDVTIFPRVRTRDFFTLLQNPTEEEYAQAIKDGERITWPKLQSIRRRCMVEFMLDDCVHAMQAQIARLERKMQERRCNNMRGGQVPRTESFIRSVAIDPPGPHRLISDNHENFSTSAGSARGGPNVRDANGIPMSRVSSYSVFRQNSFEQDLDEAPGGAFTSAQSPPQSLDTKATSNNNSANQPGSMMRSPTNLQLESKLLGRIQSVNQFENLAQRFQDDASSLGDEDDIAEGDEEQDEEEGSELSDGFGH